MSDFRLRPARETDARRIRAIIRKVRINPMDLDWSRFILAVDEQEQVVGCGQIKPHRDGSHELASIAVLSEWRGQGIARQIIEALIVSHPDTLYLTCRASLEGFYEKFGFKLLEYEEMTPYFQRLSRLSRVVVRFAQEQDGLIVMKRGN